jgi:cell division protein FtsQ
MDPDLFDEAVHGRRQTVARRRRIVASTSLACLLVVSGGGWAVTYSSVFRADQITVIGAERLAARRVVRLAGVNARTNVLHFDPDETERRLEDSPWIARATVSRDLPDQIEITVVERIPVARWSNPSTHRTMLVTDVGTLAPGSAGTRLPALVDWLGTSLLTAEDRALAASALAELPVAVRADVARAAVGPDGRLLLGLRDGPTVNYGAASETTGKAEALAAVLAWAGRTGSALGSIDVRIPSAPTARLANGSVLSPSV